MNTRTALSTRPGGSIRTGVSIGLLCLGVTSHASAQSPDDRARLDEIARLAGQRFAVARTAGEVSQTVPATTPPANATVSLTLQEATARALERNLELAVERLNPQTFDLNIARIQAAFRPTLTSQIGQRAVVQPPTNQLNGGNIVQNDTTTYNTGVSQALKWGGGNVTFQFNNNKQVTSNIFANFNPTFNSNFNLGINQPLLRGFLIDNNRQQLRVTAISRDISELQLRGTIATTLASVRNSYFELLYAIEAAQVAQGSLALAEKLVEDNRARVEIGTMAPLDVVQAEAEVATRRQTVAQAEAAWRTSELALKRLIVNGTDDPLWRASINPVDRPVFSPEPLDVEGAVRKALDNRTDLEQGRRQIMANDTTLRFMRNQILPAVDLAANYGAQGLGEIMEAGGHTLAQDKETCAVYGMPRVAVEKGHANKVMPLGEIAPYLSQKVGRIAAPEESHIGR